MLKAVNDAWLNGEVYRERGTNVRIKTDEGVYGYVNAVQTALAELDRLDAVRPYQLRLPGVPCRCGVSETCGHGSHRVEPWLDENTED